jgi:hypothetical protein
MKFKYFLLLFLLVIGFLSSNHKAKAAELIGHWKLDETTQGSSVIDSSTGGNNGTPSGTGGGPSPTSTIPSVTFSDPGSYFFNGNNQYVQIASSFKSAVSVTFWFKPLANGSGGGNDQWYNGTGLFDAEIGGVTNDFGVTWSADHVEFGIGNPDITIRSGALALGSWYHVAATWQKSDGAMKLYINGTLVASSTGSLNDRISTNVRFGVLLSGVNAYYNGYMDDIRTFDIALDQSQVQNMADGNSITLTAADNPPSGGSVPPNPPPVTPLEGFFKISLNENQATTDSSIVRLSSNAREDVVLIKLSDNESLLNGGVFSYTDGMTLDLCANKKNCPLGKHTIYAQLMNKYGLTTSILKTSIQLVEKKQLPEEPKKLPEQTNGTVNTSTPTHWLTWDEIYKPELMKLTNNLNLFEKDLKFGDVGEEVRKLQKFLNSQGFILASTSVGGAPGKETPNFQSRTYNALLKFQAFYQTQIGHEPNGIFDTETRRVANELAKK